MNKSWPIEKIAKDKNWRASPAKVNLLLEVKGRRDDGYHLLRTVISKISLGDKILLKPHDNRGRWQLLCSQKELETESNLCIKALKLLENFIPRNCKLPFQGTIYLEKNTPLGAGLGGGSSNAATVIKEVINQYSLQQEAQAIEQQAVKLGADVPFFLREGAWLMGGVGEQFISRVELPKFAILLVYPNLAINTASIYKALNKQNFSLTTNSMGDSSSQLFADVYDVVNIMKNDLAAVVEERYQTIAKIRKNLAKQGALKAMLSGSGSTVFAVFENMAEAEHCAERIKKLFDRQWLVRTALPLA